MVLSPINLLPTELHQAGFREDGSSPWSECEVTLEMVLKVGAI